MIVASTMGEAPHGLHVIEGFFYTGIAEVEPVLEKVDPEHSLQPYGRTSLSLFRIEGFEKSAKLFPRDYLFHFGEKEFPFCGFSVFLERNGARESFLSLHRTSAPWKEGRTGGTWWLWDSFYGLKEKTATSARSFSEIP